GLPFEPVFELAANGLHKKALNQFTFGALNCHRLVFVNGHFSQDLSTILPQQEGVRLGSLAAALDQDWPGLQKYLAASARREQTAFAALNTAFFQDGAFILVHPGMELTDPVH